MEIEKISYQKIAIRTLISILIMAFIIFTLNSWPNIKQSFNGNVPPFRDWMSYISKLSNLVALLAFGSFFYYRDWARQKELIENQKKIAAKHQSWLEAE